MNDAIEHLADAYDVARNAGQKEIRGSWQRLRLDTRVWLSKSEHYNERGSPMDVEYQNSDVEDLEYNLGLINLCMKAKLPQRSEKGVPIPAEACSTEVQSAFSFLMYHPCGQDPVFLRQALYALQRYEMARLLSILPAEKATSSFKTIGLILFAGFSFVLLLATPAILSETLVSVARSNYGDTATGLYALGFVAWMFKIGKGLGKNEGTKDEKTYQSWAFLNPYQSGDWTASGAGAVTYFKDMRKIGLEVPLIAFDLCESLRAKTFC
jgi:hypothetical protein